MKKKLPGGNGLPYFLFFLPGDDFFDNEIIEGGLSHIFKILVFKQVFRQVKELERFHKISCLFILAAELESDHCIIRLFKQFFQAGNDFFRENKMLAISDFVFYIFF